MSSSSFFEDGRSGRPPVQGTVARGLLRDDAHLYTGKSGATLLDTFPLPINEQSLQHGRERYDIFCSVCHGRAGTGEGMVVRRGFRQPPSFHIDRLRTAPVGHFFDVITHGFGAMPDYAALIPAHDRWEITAYVRALQLSQQTSIADVSAEGLNQLLGTRR
jgi:mono/diheme cytochrome c family protein